MNKQCIQMGMLGLALFILPACQKEEAMEMNQGRMSPQQTSVSDADDLSDESATSFARLDVQGDGFQVRGIRLGDLDSQTYGLYSTDGKSTYFTANSKNNVSIDAVFSGQKTGYAENVSMTFTSGGKTYSADNQVSLKIEEYGNVGGTIRGTFSGTFKRYDVEEKSGKRLEYLILIKNGKFSVSRRTDF